MVDLNSRFFTKVADKRPENNLDYKGKPHLMELLQLLIINKVNK
jgi:hypothetical protein